MASLDADLQGILRAAPGRRVARARVLAARGTAWAEWAEALTRLHHESPRREGDAARVLRGAYAAVGDRLMAARLRMIEARAAHRVGSPRAAAVAFERAARELEAAGDVSRAVQARIVGVDALAVAGRVDRALAVARRLRPRLRGTWARLWRHVLEVNVANALRLRGDLDGALRRYDASALAFLRLRQPQQAAIARMNAGVALLDDGRGEEALVRFERASRDFTSAGQTDMALEARYNRACALVRAARLGDGVRALESLVREHHDLGLARREALCRVDLADALLRAGDAPSARAQGERAASIFAATDAHAERSEALLVAATGASPGEASALLRDARRAARASGRPSVLLRCDLLAEDARRPGSPGASRRLAAIVRRADALGQTEVAAQARLLLGEAALSAGRVTEALERFRLASLAGRGRPWIRLAAVGGVAACLDRGGRRARALAALRELGAFLDTVRASLPGPWLRATFVLRRLDPWLAQVDLLLDRGTERDRIEAETLLDALAARRFLERKPPRRTRDPLHRRLEALYDRIGRGAGPTRGAAGGDLDRAQAEAGLVERRVAEGWRAAERRGSRGAYAARAARRRAPLAPRAAALHVWAREGRVRALLRCGRAVAPGADLGAVEGLVGEVARVEFLADRVRLFGPEGTSETLRDRLRDLAARMLAPLVRAPSIDALHLVLDPDLPDVPWESLPFRGAPLSAWLSLLRVPSLRVRGGRARRTGPTTFLAARAEDLPGVGEEAARLGPDATARVGAGATRRALAEALGRPGLVHVAGHGLSHAEAPPLGGVRLDDGWFAAVDVPRRVEADVVILAACRGGIESGPAARAWGALPAALLAAGARRVLWASSDIDDRAVAEATTRFRTHLVSTTAERALGRALGEMASDPRLSASLLPLRLSGVLP